MVRHGKGDIGHLTEERTNLFDPFERASNKVIGGLMACPSVAFGQSGGRRIFSGWTEQGRVQERIGSSEGLVVTAIRCWLQDREGEMWIGTPMGLHWWRNSGLLTFDSRHGLPGKPSLISPRICLATFGAPPTIGSSG